jgi:hypothetical protein
MSPLTFLNNLETYQDKLFEPHRDGRTHEPTYVPFYSSISKKTYLIITF